MGKNTSLPSWSSGGTTAAPQGGTSLPSWAGDVIASVDNKKPAQHKGGGGILGAVEHGAHWVAQKADLAAHDIKQTIPGVVEAGMAVSGDYRHNLAHGDANLVDVLWNGKNTKQLEKGTVESTKQTLEHPLRDPFQTVTTVLPFLSGGASLAARAGAIGDAARAGDIAGAAKAAVTKPEMPPRVLKTGDGEASLHHSERPLNRAVQAVHDNIVQRGLVNNPEGKVAQYGQWRIGNALDEEARRSVRMHEAPAAALDVAAQRLTGKLNPRQSRVGQAALELTSVNTSPADAAAYHLEQAAKGVAPDLNAKVAKLYQVVEKRGLLTKNGDGDVIVHPDHPKLVAADQALAKVQGRGDEILARYNVRTPEQLQAAADAPGRYRAGAQYEKPTPSKAGVSPALDRLRGYRAQLQRRFDHETSAPMSIEGAHARLASLEKEHNAALDKAAGALFGPVDPGEVRFRNAENARAQRQAAGVNRAGRPSGASGPKSTLRKSVTQEMRDQAERKIEATIAANPDHPIAQRWNARTAEIDHLKSTLNPDLFEKVNKRALGRTPVADTERAVRLRGAMSIADERIAQLEKQAANRVKPTGVIGGETARPGRGYISYASSEKKAPTSTAASSSSPVVGEAKAPVTSHANEGVNIAHGVVPNDITGQAGRHFRQILRFMNTTDRRNAAIQTGSDVRRSTRDVLVKIPGAEHAKLTKAVEEALGKSKPTADDIAGIHAALEAHREALVPGIADEFAADAQHPVGTTAADAAEQRGLDAPGGYKWVDRGALGELGRPSIGGGSGVGAKIGRGLDNVNSAVTAATVYFKIGHLATRAFTNAATNILEGAATPLQIKKSFELAHSLTDEEKARALAASGQHSIQALPHEGTGRVARVATKGAGWWARRIDSPFRFNAIAYEARKAGVDTPAKFRDMLDKIENPHDFNMSAAERSKVMGVANRANREGIAYDRLSDFEKRYITRAFWFWPWTAAATRFAGHTLLEHPYKSGVLGAAGVQGRQKQERDLGDVPSYEDGLFKVGGSADRPLVADFSTFNPLATSADVLHAAFHPKDISGFLNPVYSGANSLINGIGPNGAPSKAPLIDAVTTAVSPAPESQILTAFLHRNKSQSHKMFPSSPDWYGTKSQILRALLGPGIPRRANPRALHSGAAREKAGR